MVNIKRDVRYALLGFYASVAVKLEQAFLGRFFKWANVGNTYPVR